MSALLELEKISVRLGARRAVEGISLSVGGGDIIALLGPNGAGKTTLLRAAMGLIVLDAGEARLRGADPRAMPARVRATRAAYLPQRPQAIWPVSVEALVALGRFAYGAAPLSLRDKDQAAVDRALIACGLDAFRARRIDEISGGERARAHLARALAQEAPLLVLDEPTAGLDPAQALSVADILRAHAAAGGACLFSTHDVGLAARVAGRVLLLREGRAIADGAPQAALTPEALEAAYGRKGRLESIGGAFVAAFE
jgi:iron complex transport system ATP-binding protein